MVCVCVRVSVHVCMGVCVYDCVPVVVCVCMWLCAQCKRDQDERPLQRQEDQEGDSQQSVQSHAPGQTRPRSAHPTLHTHTGLQPPPPPLGQQSLDPSPHQCPLPAPPTQREPGGQQTRFCTGLQQRRHEDGRTVWEQILRHFQHALQVSSIVLLMLLRWSGLQKCTLRVVARDGLESLQGNENHKPLAFAHIIWLSETMISQTVSTF